MSSFTENILRKCKDVQGGVELVYLFAWEKYTRGQITIVDQTITAFPANTIYQVYSISTSFNETIETQGGDVAWNQSLTLEFPKTAVTSEIYKLVKRPYRAIYQDRLGNLRMLGVWNGLNGSITNETGQDKAGFNGYRVTFSGKEDNQAYWIDALPTITEQENKIFMDGNNAIMQDGANYIYN